MTTTTAPDAMTSADALALVGEDAQRRMIALAMARTAIDGDAPRMFVPRSQAGNLVYAAEWILGLDDRDEDDRDEDEAHARNGSDTDAADVEAAEESAVDAAARFARDSLDKSAELRQVREELAGVRECLHIAYGQRDDHADRADAAEAAVTAVRALTRGTTGRVGYVSSTRIAAALDQG